MSPMTSNLYPNRQRYIYREVEHTYKDAILPYDQDLNVRENNNDENSEAECILRHSTAGSLSDTGTSPSSTEENERVGRTSNFCTSALE